MEDRRLHAENAASPTLRIRDLTVDFTRRGEVARAVDGIGLDVWPGEIVGVIGESGSGKTMTVLSTLGLLPKRATVAGRIEFEGQNLIELAEAKMRQLRGDRLSFIPQDAMRALNPSMRVGRQVGEPLVLHRGMNFRSAVAQATGLLESVGIREPKRQAAAFPHEFSGGMQQRAMIAMGLALEPALLLADEPTTALDVTVQAQVLALLRQIRDTHGTSILFISHDLGVVSELCDWVYVMYSGKIVEEGSVRQIFTAPQAEYTRMLLAATPTIFDRREALA